jgi:hypothetical protein
MHSFPFFPTCLTCAGLVLLSDAASARPLAGFTLGEGSDFVDQYPGIAGEGWQGSWGNTSSSPNLTVSQEFPIRDSGNYLKGISTFNSDHAIGRAFSNFGKPGVDISQPVTFHFDLRVDSLTGWDAATDYITVHANNNATTYNVSNASSFIIRAFGATPAAGVNANEWGIYRGTSNGAGYSAALFTNSGMPFAAGVTYTFNIVCDPATKTYSGSISNGTETVTWSDAGWRSGTASDRFAINYRVGTTGDAIATSLDNLRISNPPPADYLDWSTAAGLTGGPDDDEDMDGLTNFSEYAFGTQPKNPASVQPVTLPLDKATGTFRFRRRDPALSGLTYSTWTSTDLLNWTEDTQTAQTISPAGTDLEEVVATLSSLPLTAPALHVRVKAE